MILTEIKTYNILVVDDNPGNIKILGSCLRKEKYNLGFAGNGVEALNVLKEEIDFDLILLDILMPVMNGFDTCSAIRAIDKFKDIPIIFITAFDDFDNIIKGFELGGQDYITKPFSQRELMARVKTQLELKRAKDDLRNANIWLGKEVEERTKELNLSNKQLMQQAKDIYNAYLNQKALINELEQLDESKTTLLKLISLDICAPLSKLMNFLNNLKNKFVLADNADIINIIENSSTRLERFSFVASRITQLRTGNKDIVDDFIPIVLFTDFLKEELQKRIRSVNISVNIDEDTIESSVRCDKILMQICLTCILDNVYKYSSQNSDVTVRVFSENERVVFDFINNEQAFSKEVNKNLNRVFANEEVYAEDNFGLDMALIKIIMDALKGTINIRNNDAEGAVVSLALKKF
jgi:two-component system, sensor histidine kinase and response regulator